MELMTEVLIICFIKGQRLRGKDKKRVLGKEQEANFYVRQVEAVFQQNEK